LLQARSDSQTAIIVYAGSAHTLVPLSDDLATSKNLLDAIKPSIMPESGQRADLAVKKALDLLKQGALGQGRLLLIGSSLTEQERQGIRLAMSGHPQPLLIMGVGTAEGAPVAQDKGGFLKDAQGAILLPRLDSASLKDFAEQFDGRYSSLRMDDQDLRDLGLLDSPKNIRSDGQIVQLDTWADQGYWLLLPLLLLAACAGRRGWVLCLPLLFMIPQNSYAFDFKDLWLRPDQQGQRLLERHRPVQAARRFEDPQWQGIALYEAGDYAGAAQRFAQGNSATDHYNRANALAKSGELEAALDAYDQALDRQPEFSAATANRALVQKLLEQNQQPPVEDTGKDKTEGDDDGDNPRSGAVDEHNNQQTPPQAGEENSPGSQQQVSGGNEAPGSPLDEDETTRPPMKPADSALSGEQQQALEQWLRQIPDEPGELLRRKFWYEQQQHQEKTP
jgi:Ca-activated chloride channel family protein